LIRFHRINLSYRDIDSDNGISFLQAEKEEQAAKEIAPVKDFTGPLESAPAPEPGWVNEVESATVTTENWADDVVPPPATVIPAAGAAQPFQAGGDWAAQVT
jgi:hypothetical protein